MEPIIGLIIAFTVMVFATLLMLVFLLMSIKESKDKSKEIYDISELITLDKSEIKNLKEQITQKDNTIDKSFIIAENLTKNIEKQKVWMTEMERTIEQGYGIKIRQEVINVTCDYTKLETVILYSGVHKLLKDSKNVEDSKILIKLIERMEKIMPDMKEEEEKKIPIEQGK
jgi:hypothetical protein